MKQEERPLHIPQSSSDAIHGQLSGYTLNGYQNSADFNAMRSRSFGSDIYATNNAMPTPDISPDSEGPATDCCFANNYNPYINNDCHTTLLGPQCYDNCTPSSTVPCNDPFNFPPGETEPQVPPFINPQDLHHQGSHNDNHMSWDHS